MDRLWLFKEKPNLELFKNFTKASTYDIQRITLQSCHDSTHSFVNFVIIVVVSIVVQNKRNFSANSPGGLLTMIF